MLLFVMIVYCWFHLLCFFKFSVCFTDCIVLYFILAVLFGLSVLCWFHCIGIDCIVLYFILALYLVWLFSVVFKTDLNFLPYRLKFAVWLWLLCSLVGLLVFFVLNSPHILTWRLHFCSSWSISRWLFISRTASLKWQSTGQSHAVVICDFLTPEYLLATGNMQSKNGKMMTDSILYVKQSDEKLYECLWYLRWFHSWLHALIHLVCWLGGWSFSCWWTLASSIPRLWSIHWRLLPSPILRHETWLPTKYSRTCANTATCLCNRRFWYVYHFTLLSAVLYNFACFYKETAVWLSNCYQEMVLHSFMH